MNRTECATLVLEIANRVLAERDKGDWPVDPMRLEWAETIVRQNAPSHKSCAHTEAAS